MNRVERSNLIVMPPDKDEFWPAFYENIRIACLWIGTLSLAGSALIVVMWLGWVR